MANTLGIHAHTEREAVRSALADYERALIHAQLDTDDTDERIHIATCIVQLRSARRVLWMD